MAFQGMSDLQTRCMEVVVDRLAELTLMNPVTRRLEFKSTLGFSLHYLADEFLQMLQRKGRLSDVTLSLFHNTADCVTSCLQRVHISGRTPALNPRTPWGLSLTNRGLEVLATHSLSELDMIQVRGVRVDLTLKGLNRVTRHNLHRLRVERVEMGSVTASVACRFPHIRSLSVVAAGFNDADVCTIASANLPHLECLDISSNGNITSILPLVVYRHQLRSLAVRDCNLEDDLTLPMLEQMSQLQRLDVLLQSAMHASYADQHTWFYYVSRRDHKAKLKGESILALVDSMPHLTFLDISGRGMVAESVLGRFLQSHKALRFLGLVNTEVSLSPLLCGDPKERIPNLRVFGDCTEEQLLEALRRYVPLDVLMYDVLRRLRTFCHRTVHREEVVKLVLQCLGNHQASQWMETFHEAVLCLTYLIPLHVHGVTPLDPALVTLAVELTNHTWKPFRKKIFQQQSCNSLKQHALGGSVKVFLSSSGHAHRLPV